MSLKLINTIAKVNSKQAKIKIAETVSKQQFLKHELDLLKLLFNIRKKNKKIYTILYHLFNQGTLTKKQEIIFPGNSGQGATTSSI